jgi:sRNA-binding carbon storage regulator CsrA
MLVLTRTTGQTVVYGQDPTTTEVTVVAAGEGWAKLGFNGASETPVWRAEVAAERDLDDFIERLMRNIPEAWGSSEGSAESIVIDYVRALEARLTAAGGSLYPDGYDKEGNAQ